MPAAKAKPTIAELVTRRDELITELAAVRVEIAARHGE